MAKSRGASHAHTLHTSLQRTLTTFLVDISETMGQERVVQDEVTDENGNIEQHERVTSKLEWCLEFVTRKTTSMVSRHQQVGLVLSLTSAHSHALRSSRISRLQR